VLISGGEDDSIWVWDVNTGATIGGRFVDHADLVNAVALATPRCQAPVAPSTATTAPSAYGTTSLGPHQEARASEGPRQPCTPTFAQ
jgi:hypothetical protein